MNKNFTGTGVALVTPFHKEEDVDFTALGNIIENIISSGVDYIVCLGTTSEAATMNSQERRAVLDYTIEVTSNRVPIVLGLGGNNTRELMDKINHTDFSGVSALLSVAPYYNKPNQRGIYEHFKYVASSSPVPVLLYNVPGRTSSNIEAQTAVHLAQTVPNIIGIKEASGNFAQVMELLRTKPKDFIVISGEDALTLPLMSLGVKGVISVTANAFPKQVSTMVNLCLKGKFTEAQELHYQLLPITNALFADGNPAGVKAALEIQKVCKAHLRLPLVNINETLQTELAVMIKEIK
jgi:dihydrodipicolinate synthase